MSFRKKKWQKLYEEGEKKHLKRMKDEFGKEEVENYVKVFHRSHNTDDIVQESSHVEQNWNSNKQTSHYHYHQSDNKGCIWTFFGCFGIFAFGFMLFIIFILILANGSYS